MKRSTNADIYQNDTNTNDRERVAFEVGRQAFVGGRSEKRERVKDSPAGFDYNNILVIMVTITLETDINRRKYFLCVFSIVITGRMQRKNVHFIQILLHQIAAS